MSLLLCHPMFFTLDHDKNRVLCLLNAVQTCSADLPETRPYVIHSCQFDSDAPFPYDSIRSVPLYPVSSIIGVFLSKITSACHLLTCWFLLKLFLRPWRQGRYVPPKRRLQLRRLHGVTSQKMILFITTAVKTSNPTQYLRNFLVPPLFISLVSKHFPH
jgi:hypothetical protein